MADETPSSITPSEPKVFRIKRLTIGVNVLTQVALLFFIIGLVNFVAFNHFKRWDFTRNQKYALSSQTKQLVSSLQKTLKAIVFFSPTSFSPDVQIYPDVEALLKEYQYASGRKVEVEFVNPAKDLSRARELQEKYKFGASENIVILDYEGRNKVVNASVMAEFDQGNPMMGEQPKLKAFKGEQALTSALLEIIEDKKNAVYFVTGHGEPDVEGRALTILKAYIERQNIKLDSFNLLNVDAVPAEAKAVALIGPKYDLTDREIGLLKTFWEKKGRLFVALDPNASTPRLQAWLQENGVTVENDRILRTINLGAVAGIVRDVIGSFSESSPVGKKLQGADVQLFGPSASLKAGNAAANISVRPVITAAEGFWGETDYSAIRETGVSFDPQKDHPAPLQMALSVEKGALENSSVQIDSARMVVVGNATFLVDEGLRQGGEPGVDFMLASLNWLLDREELIGIAPKEQKSFTLNLREEDVRTIKRLTFFDIYFGWLPLPGAIPLVMAAIGAVVMFGRRR